MAVFGGEASKEVIISVLCEKRQQRTLRTASYPVQVQPLILSPLPSPHLSLFLCLRLSLFGHT